jgi:hypothetical protein
MMMCTNYYIVTYYVKLALHRLVSDIIFTHKFAVVS